MTIQDFTMGDLLTAMVHYRSSLEAINADAAAKSSKPSKMLDAIMAELTRRAAEQGLKSIPCHAGTLSVVDTRRYNIADPATFTKHVLETKDLSFFGKSINKAAVEDYEKLHGGVLPPGVGTHIQRTLRFTAANKA